jgi:exosortase K
LIAPTNYLIELITSSPAQYAAESGYFHKELNIVIEKSCSGFNFWILCFIMLAFLALNYCSSYKQKILVLPTALFISYILTIFANSSRIILSILGQNAANDFIHPRPHLILHNVIGTFVYLFFLIISYLVLNYILKKKLHNAKFT